MLGCSERLTGALCRECKQSLIVWNTGIKRRRSRPPRMLSWASFALTLAYPAGESFGKICRDKIHHWAHVPTPDSFVMQKAFRGKLSTRHPKRCGSVVREQTKKIEGRILFLAVYGFSDQ